MTVFPYPGGARKYRKGFEKDEERLFWWDPPTSAGQVPFLPPDFEPRERIILVEGETDTMAAWQALPDDLRDKVAIVGLSGTGSWTKAITEKGGIENIFGPARRVFVVFDRDDPYENPDGAKSVERAWQTIRSDLGRKARRVVLPQGINDVAEFFQRYDWAAFQVLLQKAAEPKRHYKRLDLTKPVPDTDWLVEDLLVAHEATVVAGDSGVGKSFITMALALCVADPKCESFLGLPVKKHGSVIYVDEENSAQLVLQRLAALGHDPVKHAALEYLWYEGVDLVNEPEKLLEEAIEIEPALIVLDSQSRVALGVEENSNTDISQLYRTAIVPLARETGAGVVVIHHTPSDGRAKPRGASAIKAAADQVISVVAAKAGELETGRLNIFPSKPRRRTALLQAEIEGDVEKDGWVRVKALEEETPF